MNAETLQSESIAVLESLEVDSSSKENEFGVTTKGLMFFLPDTSLIKAFLIEVSGACFSINC
jgi:hypothetical protein